jgi:hypothetical protein
MRMNKYLIFAFVIASTVGFGCNSNQMNKNASSGLSEKFITDTILSLEEVKGKNRFIDSISNHKKSIAIMVEKPNNQEPNYHIQAGYNGEETFETYFHFYMDTVTKQISIDDFASGNRISLDDWRNQNGDSIYSTLGMALLESERFSGLKIDLKEDSIIKVLGKPDNTSNATKWDADGLFHQTWTYKAKGVELDVCWEKPIEKRIYSISISKPSNFKTSRGIGVGSAKEQVLKLYKNEIDPKAENDSSIVAGTVFGGIIFEIEKNHVKSIFIGAASE